MKLCRTCNTEKDESEFNWKIKDEARQSKCRECQKAYHKTWYVTGANSSAVKKRASQSNKNAVARNRAYVLNLLKESSCSDCPNDDVRVLEFDHLADKEYSIADLIRQSYGLEKLIKEIAKCEIVCANCHRIRTLERLREKGFEVYRL